MKLIRDKMLRNRIGCRPAFMTTLFIADYGDCLQKLLQFAEVVP
jgi:hypothetical protein